jgi:chorismate-pyruvate lyase
MTMRTASQNHIRQSTSSIAHPLDEFYLRSGMSLPPLKQIDAEEVPEPYKTLLVHQNDMTSTLEAFHKGTIHLRVLGRERRGTEYYREVVLHLGGSEKPVEFGAIQIHLDRFNPQAREQILAERWPLGHILKDCAMIYTSQPKAFLQIASDKLINSVLNLTGAQLLYGRRNTLLDAAEKPLAEIVEILPPTKLNDKD